MPASGTISALNKAGSHAGYKAVDIANSTEHQFMQLIQV